MPRSEWLGTKTFYGENGEFRETARAFIQEVFLENIEVDSNGCWLFLPSTPNVDFYRRFIWNGKTVTLHRFSYELWKERIPKGLLVLHSCDNRPCCNPEHLRAGTSKENYADARSRGRIKSGQSTKTHCPQGHSYEESATVYHGRRYCSECHRVYSREWAARNKEHKAAKLREWRARKRGLAS